MLDDRTALVQGIAANPEADLPRLVYADWLEEHDDPEQAAFIRAQVEYAQGPEWAPFAVYCRHRKPEWHTGTPWRLTLPQLHPIIAEWPSRPFRRGLGWSLIVRQLASFLDVAETLFREVPIGQLALPTGTLHDWERFCDQPWLSQIESIHFYGLDSPIEPIRLLCRHADRTNLKEVVFEQSSRPGIPVLVEDLVDSPLGERLKSLEFRAGPVDSDDLIQAIIGIRGQLDRLAFRAFQFREQDLSRLASAAFLPTLRELEWQACYFPNYATTAFLASAPFRQLQHLNLTQARLHEFQFEKIGQSPAFSTLCQLDLSHDKLYFDAWREILLAPYWTNLRSLRVRNTGQMGAPYNMMELIRKARFWNNLVELDLRDERTSELSLQQFLYCELPSELVSLLLTRPADLHRLPTLLGDLRARHGEVISLEEPERLELR